MAIRSFVLFCCLLPFFAFSQTQKELDSLKKVFSNQTGDEKAITAYRIADLLLYNDLESAKNYISEGIKTAEKGSNALVQTRAYNIAATYYSLTGQQDSSRFYYEKGLKKVEKANSPLEKSKLLYGLANIEFNKGNLKNADSIFKLSLNESITANDTIGIALAYQAQSNIYENQGFYDKATKQVFKSLEILEKTGDSARIADTYYRLAVLEYRTKNFLKAIEYNQEAIKIYDQINDQYFKAQALNDIGVNYKKLNDLPNAEKYYIEALEIAQETKNIALQGSLLQNLGTIYTTTNRYNQGIQFLKESIELSESIKAKRRVATAKIALARAFANNDENDLAIEIIDKSTPYLLESENLSLLVTALKVKSDAHKNQSNFKLAIETFEASQTLKDSLFNEETSKEIETIRTVYELDKKEAEIALQQEEIKTLNAQAKNDKLTKTLYGIGMFSFISISGLLFFGFRQKMKKNKIAREKQEEIYRQEIEFKKRELASQTLHLVKKSTFIQELKENLEKIKQSPELYKVEFRRLVLLLNKESAEDKDWEIFKSYFSEVHSNFDETLKSIAKGITEKELRMASFLKMNLSTKEIASLLNVLPDSVLKSKYRLKKKLQVDKEVDLVAFLNSL